MLFDLLLMCVSIDIKRSCRLIYIRKNSDHGSSFVSFLFSNLAYNNIQNISADTFSPLASLEYL